MALDVATKKKLARLADRDRRAQSAATAIRDEFLEAIIAARATSTVREIASIVGISHQRVHELTTVRNRVTGSATRRREQT